MTLFEGVYAAALNLLPNNNILNLISKAKQEPYKSLVLELFQTPMGDIFYSFTKVFYSFTVVLNSLTKVFYSFTKVFYSFAKILCFCTKVFYRRHKVLFSFIKIIFFY